MVWLHKADYYTHLIYNKNTMKTITTENPDRGIDIRRIREIGETALIVVVVLMFCTSMTIPAKTNIVFGAAFDLMIFVCILYGIIINLVKHKEIDKTALILTMAYFITRLISYTVNSLPITYGGSIMLQMFYMIGINKQVICNKKRAYVALYSFLAFDVIAVLMCLGIYRFRPDYADKLVEPYLFSGGLPDSCLFQNPNYAGMMTAAAIIICIAFIANSRFDKKVCALMIPIAALNLYMLFAHTSCRSGQLGLILIVVLVFLLFTIKRIDSIKWIISLSLIACFLLLVPVGVLAYSGDNENHISDSTPMEMRVDLALTGRYALWKTTILSQKGHWVLGYGNNKKANKARIEYINEHADLDTANIEEYFYWLATIHTRQHNGYIALINEAGLAGALAILALLLYRIMHLKGRFRDDQWEKILLVYIFWINIFEAKFLLQQFFTGLLVMILLMPDCGEDGSIYE